MLLANSIECTEFPVKANLRDRMTVLNVHEDGRVFVQQSGQSPMLIAQCDQSSPAFRAFLEFWAIVFAKGNSDSLAFNQLVEELVTGRVTQDEDCPYLFIDKDHLVGEASNPLWHPLIEARADGTIKTFNPDPFYRNAGFVLTSNPRIKFYMVIEDFEGNDLPSGFCAGVTTEAGKLPVFDTSRLCSDEENIETLAGPLLEDGYKPKAAPASPADFDDDDPF